MNTLLSTLKQDSKETNSILTILYTTEILFSTKKKKLKTEEEGEEDIFLLELELTPCKDQKFANVAS